MFYSIPNLSADQARPVEPWAVTSPRPAGVTDKTEFIKWCSLPTTQHHFISTWEGVFKHQRVRNMSNPAVFLNGFIVDYDGQVLAENLAAITKSTLSEYKPAWHCRTFSNRARLIWKFEAPLRMPESPRLVEEFLKVAAKQLKLSKWLAGLDLDTFRNPCQYYELGTEWTPVLGAHPIRTSTLWQWMYDAGTVTPWDDRTCRIPIIDVSAEVEKRWPGKWQGAFDLGMRGIRFWDDTADNQTAAVVRESGMQCFTGSKTFVSWQEIFGNEFVQQYTRTQLGNVAEGIFFDGKLYWWQDDMERWNCWQKEDLRLQLRVKHHLRATASKQDANGVSEVDAAIDYVHTHNRVEAALPFLHRPAGIIMQENLRFLNISRCLAMPPPDVCVEEWGKGFPWIARFLDEFFGEKQKPFFLAWLAHFYANAAILEPRAGQAVFLVGDPGIGKTMLVNLIVGRLVGGCVDASGYFLGESNFSADTLDKPIMLIDDTAPSTDHVRHTRYSAMVKKIVANRQLRYEQKYQKAGMVSWMGRVMVCCNSDPESIKLIPSLEMSIIDKVSLFLCRRPTTPFPVSKELHAIIDGEIASFAGWLMQHEPDAEHLGASRYGAAAFSHKTLVAHALQSSPSYAFYELLTVFLKAQKGVFPDRVEWTGTSTELYSAISADEALRPLVSRYTVGQIGSFLGQLRSRGYAVGQRRNNKCREWLLPFDLQAPVKTAGETGGLMEEPEEEVTE